LLSPDVIFKAKMRQHRFQTQTPLMGSLQRSPRPHVAGFKGAYF